MCSLLFSSVISTAGLFVYQWPRSYSGEFVICGFSLLFLSVGLIIQVSALNLVFARLYCKSKIVYLYMLNVFICYVDPYFKYFKHFK